MAPKWILVGITSSFLALLFNVIAIATPNWLLHHTADDTVNVGIFKICQSHHTDCGDLGDLYALLDVGLVVWFHIAQSFFTLGVLGSLFLFVVPLLLLFKFFDVSNWYRPIAAIAFATTMVLTVPVVILAYFGSGLFVLDSTATRLDWSYGLALVGLLAMATCCVAFFVQSLLHRRSITLTARPIITVWQKPYSVFVNEDV